MKSLHSFLVNNHVKNDITTNIIVNVPQKWNDYGTLDDPCVHVLYYDTKEPKSVDYYNHRYSINVNSLLDVNVNKDNIGDILLTILKNRVPNTYNQTQVIALFDPTNGYDMLAWISRKNTNSDWEAGSFGTSGNKVIQQLMNELK